MDQEVKDARARLAAKFGDCAQIGGKGKFFYLLVYLIGCKGTQRRTKKKTHVQTQVTEDKKLKSAIKKYGKYFCPLGHFWRLL